MRWAPFLNALVGQFRLTVFINRQTDEVIVVRQAFRRFEVVTRGLEKWVKQISEELHLEEIKNA
jgi:hypothetical protein